MIKLLSSSSSSMGIWTSDRNDGDALVELQTHSCIAMIEAPWAVRARCLAAVSYSRPHLIRIPIPSPPSFNAPRRPAPPRSHLHHPPGAWAGSEGADDMRDGR